MPEIADDDLLSIVKSESEQAIGFNFNAGELEGKRTTALNYVKGEMPDMPAPANRSKAVSTDCADAIETALPSLIEIFAGGDDVFTFRAAGEQDEKQAKQETDYVKHVIFNENAGFLSLYSMFKDALTVGEGLIKFWRDPSGEPVAEKLTGVTPVEFEALQQADVGELHDVEAVADEFTGDVTYSFTLKPYRTRSAVKIEAVAPEDFGVAIGTVNLRDATYCVMRSRTRVQDLIADGVDADAARALPVSTFDSSDTPERTARDTVGESDSIGVGSSMDDLRWVQVLEHYVRLWDGEKYCIHMVLTDENSSTILTRAEVGHIPFASVTPFIVPHRYHGISLADKLVEIQRIKTLLTRMQLDSGYFALNQRLELAMDQITPETMQDLMRVEPGIPVRTRSGTALRPLNAGGLGFDVLGSLEYFSIAAEQRSGIIRNAQGLAPDTMHSTATGAAALMAAAQQRLRLIARIFAETGLKDLYRGVHALLREERIKADGIRLGQKWTKIDTATFKDRPVMEVEVGEGSAGREREIAAIQTIIPMQLQAIQMQGGVNGPLVTLKNVYGALDKLVDRLGLKNVETYFTAPPEGEQQQQQEPPPDPAIVKAQMDAALKREQMQLDATLEREKIASQERMKREQLAAEVQLKQQQLQLEANMKAFGLGGGGGGGQVRFGGDVG